MNSYPGMNKAQLAFLEQLGERIPRLFDAIAQGNVKSEFIVGVRTINGRQVRLKLVAEVVDPGSNPLATHGQVQPRAVGGGNSEAAESGIGEGRSRVGVEDSAVGPVKPPSPEAGPTSPGPATRRRSRR